MNFEDYQSGARATCLPNAYMLHNYLAPGLFAEVGEVLQVFAKGCRDSTPRAEYMPKVAKEYGDCYWMNSIGLDAHGVHDVTPAESLKVPWDFAVDNLAQQAARVLGDPKDAERWERMWHLLDAYCEAVTGKTPDEVKAINLAKLADRQARGVVGGSGDAR